MSHHGVHKRPVFSNPHRAQHKKRRNVRAKSAAAFGAVGVAAATSVLLISTTTTPETTAEITGPHAVVPTAKPVPRLTTPPVTHPTPAVAATSRYYYVKAGDNLESIAQQVYGTSRDWSGIFKANPKLTNPNMVLKGWELKLPATGSDPAVALPTPSPAVAPPPAVPVYAKPQSPTPTVSYSGAGTSAYEQCVISAESGGDSQIVNASGHYGLFQFAYQTWVDNGGSPDTFGHATVAEQQAVFTAAYAADGTQPWESDGCQNGTKASVTGPLNAALDAKTESSEASHLAHLAHLHHLHMLHLAQLAKAAHPVVASTDGNAALNWAIANTTGAAYVWGGTGPGYDCSGLVQSAFAHVGVFLPRTTYDMLDSSHLHRVMSPARGDLVFFGTGHVEIYTGSGHVTFGAHESGQPVGDLNWGDAWPLEATFYHVS